MTTTDSVLCSIHSFIPNGVVLMPRRPAHAGGGRDAGPAGLPDEPVPAPDWMTGAEWEAWCDLAAGAEDGPPPDLGWDEDPEPEPAGGERVAWTAGFAKGGLADGLPGGSELAFLAGAAAEDEDRYPGATDAELDGAIAAWDRVEAHASARKHLAIAEFIRRRPEQGCEPAEPGGMPARWDEFAVDELRVLLAESKAAAERMLDRAHSLAARLPGTMDQYRSGKLRESKVMIIVDVTEPLDEQESRAAEELVLGRAGRLTPGRAAPGGRAGGDGSRPGQGQEAARGRREGRPGGAVGRGLRQRRPDGPGTAPGRGAGGRSADHRLGAPAAQGRAGRGHGRAAGPGLPGPAPGPGLPPLPRGRPGAGRCGGGRVRGPGHPDGTAGRPDRGGGPARAAERPRARRPVAGPRPGRRGRPEPADQLVRDRDQRARARRLPRLRPPRTQQPGRTREPPGAGETRQARETGQTRGSGRGSARRAGARPGRREPGRAGRAGVQLHPRTRGRPAGWAGDLAAADPRTRTGPDRGASPPQHRELRPPVRRPRAQPRSEAAAPGADPARHLCQPGLPPPRQPVRLRAQHPVRKWRQDVPVQRRPEVPP